MKFKSLYDFIEKVVTPASQKISGFLEDHYGKSLNLYSSQEGSSLSFRWFNAGVREKGVMICYASMLIGESNEGIVFDLDTRKFEVKIKDKKPISFIANEGETLDEVIDNFVFKFLCSYLALSVDE